jgi:hypothetical protein
MHRSSFRKLCFEMAHLDNALQLHRSEKISETSYPPSLFEKDCQIRCKGGLYPRLETPEQPDEPDVLDAGDVVEHATPGPPPQHPAGY